MDEEPANRENNRNPDGTFIKGVSGNPSGRPKNTMKDHVRVKFSDMTPEQKDQWLIDNKIGGLDQWKMGEGNPKNDVEHSGGLTISQVLDEVENE